MNDDNETIQEQDNVNHLIIIDIDNIKDMNMYYGHWQMYLFSKSADRYMPTGNYFIYYKGHYFRDLKSKPMSKEEIERIKLMTNIYNAVGNPICVFRKEKDI